jgi:hypothetical protein
VIVVTFGGVTVGLIVLARFLIGWWPGYRPLRKKPLPYLGQLLPFVFAWCYGVLGILTGMGFIGWAFDTALWASNWLGDAALWLGVGESPGQQAGAVYQPLSAFGNCVMVVITCVLPKAIEKLKSGGDLRAGVWCGLCLGTSAGVAGLAAVPLAEGINWVGAVIYGAFQ